MNDHMKGGSCPEGTGGDIQLPVQDAVPEAPLNDPTLSERPILSEEPLTDALPETAAPEDKPLSAPGAEAGEALGQHKVRNAITIAVTVILIVLLLPLLCINLTLIIKGSLNPDTPPDIFGTAPLAVTTDAMAGDAEGCFDEGALIFVDLLTAEEVQSLETGDVITFRSSDDLFVTLRITEVLKNDAGEVTAFSVIGDKDAADGVNVPLTVSASNVIGVVTGSVANLGGFAMFLQTPVGVLVFVGIPVVLYVVYDIVRITVENRRKRAAEAERLRKKDEEIARLRAMVGGEASEASAEGAEEPLAEGAEPAFEAALPDAEE